MSNLELSDYVQIFVNFFYGALETTFTSKNDDYGNCTIQFSTQIIYWQQLSIHFNDARWEEVIYEGYQMMM